MKFFHKNSKNAQTAAPVLAPTTYSSAAPIYYAVPTVAPTSAAPLPISTIPVTQLPPVLNQPNLVYVGSTVPVTRTAPVVAQTGVYTAPIQSTYLTPNYSKLLRKVHLLNEAMVRLQRERIAQEELDVKGMRVFQELQVVLADIETFLATKNGDMKFQQLADHFFTLAGELRNDRELAAFVSSWKASRAGNGNNVDGTVNNVSVLFHDIKASRNIYNVFTEGLTLAENLLSSEEHDMEAQKKKIYEEIIELLKGISENPRWKAIAGDTKEDAAGLNARARQAVSNRPHLRLKQRPTFEIFMADLKRGIEVLMVDHDGAAVDKFFHSIDQFLSEITKSDSYHSFMKDAREAVTEIMEDPDILSDPNTRELLWGLWNTFVEMISEAKKHPSFLEAFNESKHILKSLTSDPYAHNILSHAKILIKDIYKNEEGRLMDFSLIPQFKHILVPLMLESFREVRIPPIQGVTPNKKLKYHVSGIVLSSIEMLPENIKIEATYRMNTDPLRLDVHEKDIILWVEADHVRARVTGAVWNYERLVFPRVGDSGLVSVVLGGQGARVGAKIRIHKQGSEHVMQVIDSYCNISRLDLAMYECKYATIYKAFHKKLVAQLKSVIELGVAEKLTQLVTGLDRTVLSSIMKAQTAKKTIVKTARASKTKIIKKKKKTTTTETEDDGEKKSKKEKLMGLATSSSTKRRGLSMIHKARKATQSKADKRPALQELNHAPPPAPLGAPSTLPPLVAPSTNPLPPLVAPSTSHALPPLVAPSTSHALPPLVAPSTNPLPPLVAPSTSNPLPPLAAPVPLPPSPASIAPVAPLAHSPFSLAPLRKADHLTSSDAADMGIGGTHVTTTMATTPGRIHTATGTNDSEAAGIVANMQKSSEIVPPPAHFSGVPAI